MVAVKANRDAGLPRPAGRLDGRRQELAVEVQRATGLHVAPVLLVQGQGRGRHLGATDDGPAGGFLLHQEQADVCPRPVPHAQARNVHPLRDEQLPQPASFPVVVQHPDVAGGNAQARDGRQGGAHRAAPVVHQGGGVGHAHVVKDGHVGHDGQDVVGAVPQADHGRCFSGHGCRPLPVTTMSGRHSSGRTGPAARAWLPAAES